MRGEGWSSPLGMRLGIGQRMIMGISGRSEAHCLIMVVDIQRGHGTLPYTLSAWEQQKEPTCMCPMIWGNQEGVGTH